MGVLRHWLETAKDPFDIFFPETKIESKDQEEILNKFRKIRDKEPSFSHMFIQLNGVGIRRSALYVHDADGKSLFYTDSVNDRKMRHIYVYDCKTQKRIGETINMSSIYKYKSKIKRHHQQKLKVIQNNSILDGFTMRSAKFIVRPLNWTVKKDKISQYEIKDPGEKVLANFNFGGLVSPYTMHLQYNNEENALLYVLIAFSILSFAFTDRGDS